MDIQIFILSKLMEDNTYPYKLKKQLSEPIPLDELSGLTESKLYYHFDSLEKKNFIEAVEVIKEENRPDKKVFKITDKGREELPKLIYKMFENGVEIKGMMVGIVNLKYVDREKVIKILEKKLADSKERWNYIKNMQENLSIEKEREELVKFLVRYVEDKAENKLQWLEELVEQIRQGKF
ncbi:PadR family transcriptional regulator [Bacillus weihaiensis]|uniref:Transcriptional regulator n=1 Tax=Bacillus weihaiensis TaxID=1547283 RepID=A0A1L3MMY1_9BACI|nr:helix-turn-helix transcriptional regulator [Bacillus weihaiensis]APH03687.1 transcriptional regulator [Bacillus weihaiensis]